MRSGLAGEAAGSAISSLIGGFTTTAYPQNVGLLNLTGEGKLRTRTPVIIAAVLLLILGFVPKAGALLSVIPSAVVGGIFLPAGARPNLIHGPACAPCARSLMTSAVKRSSACLCCSASPCPRRSPA